MLKFSKFIILWAVVVLVACGKADTTEVKPIIQDIQEWVFAPGQIEWDEEYNLTAQTDGILLDADFDIGTIVKKGIVIARLDNPTNQINTATAKDQMVIADENLAATAPALEQLKQNIAFAEAKYQQDKVQVDRYERLFKNESISKVEYENAKLAAENALTNLKALQYQQDIIHQQARQQKISTKGQLRSNQVSQSYNKIKILADGKVIKKFKSTGDFVRRGDVIAVVANPSKVEIVIFVDEGSINRINIGQQAVVSLNSEKEKTYLGKVSEIQAVFDANSQSFVCKIVLNEDIQKNKNIYGTPLECNILVGEKKQALLIPRKYIGYGNKVLLKGMDTTIIIKAGIISTDYVEVLDGIQATDILLPIKP